MLMVFLTRATLPRCKPGAQAQRRLQNQRDHRNQRTNRCDLAKYSRFVCVGSRRAGIQSSTKIAMQIPTRSIVPRAADQEVDGEAGAWDVMEFVRWASSNGLKGKGLGFATGEDGERGLVAQMDLPQDVPLLVVPYTLAMTDELHLLNPPPNSADHWAVVLALRVVQELRRGSTSLWAPYLASLPASPPALWWLAASGNQDLLGEAQYPPAIRQAELMARDVRSTFSKVGDAALMGASMDEFLWAVAMVHSRSMGVEQASGKLLHVLTPLADMLNHAGDEAKHPYERGVTPGSGGATHNVEWVAEAVQDALCFVSSRPMRAGEEAVLCYGNRSNDHFLLYYGFVPRANVHDDIVLFDSVDALLDWYAAKQGALNAQVQEAARRAVAATEQAVADGGDSEIVAAEPRLKMVSNCQVDARLVAALAALAGPAQSEGKGVRLAQSDIEHAYSCIRARCQEMLDQMPTSLMEDVALLVCSSSEEPQEDDPESAHWFSVWNQYRDLFDWQQSPSEVVKGMNCNASSMSYELQTMVEFRAYKKMLLVAAQRDLVI